ncbi:lanthionine synthetase C family protein [Streptomyces lydicus]|uniref:lanthionine synthetase C family protein n=1 Tax=Streptomyces lydicus TaxID=47763 RepID=UPI0037886072
MTATREHLTNAAREVAERVGYLLRSPVETSAAARRWRSAAAGGGWDPASYLTGHTGIATLHAALDQTDDPGWAKFAHAHLAIAAAEADQATAGDLLFPARMQAATRGGYRRLLKTSARVLASCAVANVGRLETQRRGTPGLAAMDYDTISGLARQGRLLLLADDHPGCAAALEQVLSCLVRITQPIQIAGRGVPGWWCSPDRYPIPDTQSKYPQGDFNLGAAHGICGPLSLLALAFLAGHRLPGHRDAIRRTADWIVGKTLTAGGAISWPARVAYEQETQTAELPTPPAQSGWCYGTAGIARALYLAGEVLEDQSLAELATTAIRVTTSMARVLPDLRGPTLCHGRAGVLLSAVRMAAATGDTRLWQETDGLARHLIDEFSPDEAHFGFRHHVVIDESLHHVDEPGLLEGAAGVALTLLTYANVREERSNPHPTLPWDAGLLLS